jgi:microcystin-dependent protein
MSNQFVGEVRLFAGSFAPLGWTSCEGQLLSISQNQVLFTLIGTTYGGDGVNTFALPDLRGRVPVHQGTAVTGTPYVIGQLTGSENVTLTTQQLPSHTHVPNGSSGGPSASSPSGAVWATETTTKPYGATAGGQMNAGVLATAGNNQPHDNISPYQALYFIIAIEGIFPTRS